MKRIFTVVVTLAMLIAHAAFAQDVKEAEALMKKTFSNVGIDSFRESEVKGLYEVGAGNQVFYFSPEGYLFFGEIWSREGKSITAERRAQIATEKLEGISLEKAVKIGNGPKKVIEVSDPDCLFCRKASEYFSKRTDVTRYVFLFPLSQIHPDAERKAKYILCSRDQAKAYEEVFSGKHDKDLQLMPLCEPKASEVLSEHRAVAQKLGVQGTPAFWIKGKFVSGANTRMIEQLLKEGGEKE